MLKALAGLRDVLSGCVQLPITSEMIVSTIQSTWTRNADLEEVRSVAGQ